MRIFTSPDRVLALAAFAVTASTAGVANAAAVLDPANGYYYEAVQAPAGITWSAAEAAAVAAGGQLATPMNAAENAFVFSLVDSPAFFTGTSVNGDILGPWIGIYSTAAANGSFMYASGGALSGYSNWYPGQPDGYGGGAQGVTFYDDASLGSTWGDDPQAGVQGFSLPLGYVVEFTSNPSTVPAVPEPASTALMLLGLGCVVAYRLRSGTRVRALA